MLLKVSNVESYEGTLIDVNGSISRLGRDVGMLTISDTDNY